MPSATPENPSRNQQVISAEDPPLGTSILKAMQTIDLELERRHGEDYSPIDFFINSADLAAKNGVLLLGMILVAAPEAAVHSAFGIVRQVLSRMDQERGYIRLPNPPFQRST